MHNPIFLVGMPGAGKTTIGQLLSAELNMPFIDLDEYIEAQQGKTVREIFAAEGEVFFRELEKNALHELVQKAEGAIVATGGGAPCFHNNMEFMNEVGTTIYLKAPEEILVERLLGYGHRPLIAGKTPEEVKLFISETLSKRSQFYEAAHVTYQNPGLDITDLCLFIKRIESSC
ncbi:shikimate kinase [Adhaeribacter aquaticus]|uniref:shikimate kinase n=1 Tax=Adhaeribacter aquaticus TaxID=299567 RepID=UPI00047923BF|nr:shikimate kinase [Adhaeribacter aquaticus]